MRIEPDALKGVFSSIHLLTLEPEDADTIMAISQLVVDIDGREGPDEIQQFFAIGKLLYELAEQPGTEIPTFASDEDDEQRMFDLATQLKGMPARELAYAAARLLADVDLDVAPEEDTFLDRLRGILEIGKPRAAAIAEMLREASTPSPSTPNAPSTPTTPRPDDTAAS